MADRTSAEIFGRIFKLLADDPTDENKRLAHKIFQISSDYDFSPDQMYADEACLSLDLARNGIHPDYPRDGVIMLFLGEPGFDNVPTWKPS